MYCTPLETRKARNQYNCMNCGEAIQPGEDYVRWMSVDEGKAIANKMHPECFDCLAEDGPFEYTPYSGERPEKI